MASHASEQNVASGHGAQIALSDATRLVIAPRLQSEATMRRLGEFQHKGVPSLEILWQLDVPDLPQVLPPLRLDASPPEGQAR